MINSTNNKTAVKNLMAESQDPFYTLREADERPVLAEADDRSESAGAAPISTVPAAPDRFAMATPAAIETNDKVTRSTVDSISSASSTGSMDSGNHLEDRFSGGKAAITPALGPVIHDEGESLERESAALPDRHNGKTALETLREAGFKTVSPVKRNALRRVGGLALVFGALWGVNKVGSAAIEKAGGAAISSTNQTEALADWNKYYAISQGAIRPALQPQGVKSALGARGGAGYVLNALFSEVRDREARLAFFSSAVQLAVASKDSKNLTALYAQGNGWAKEGEEVKSDYRFALTMKTAAARLSEMTQKYPSTSANWREREIEWGDIARERHKTIKGSGWTENHGEIRAALSKAVAAESKASKKLGGAGRAGFTRSVQGALTAYNGLNNTEVVASASKRAGR